MFKFDIETVVTPAVRSAKTFTSLIMIDSVKNAADSVIDANAELARAFYAESAKYFKAS